MIDVLFFGVFTGPPVFSYLARGVWLIDIASPGGDWREGRWPQGARRHRQRRVMQHISMPEW